MEDTPSFDYENDTAIDPDQLFEEWIGLSGTFFRYQKAYVKADKAAKKAWERTKTIRANLVAESGGKNEAQREAYFRPHPDYIEARSAQIDAEYERDMIHAAIQALYRKEKGLEGAAKMAQMEWWRGPKELVEVKGGKRMGVIEEMKTERAQDRRRTTAKRKRK